MPSAKLRDKAAAIGALRELVAACPDLEAVLVPFERDIQGGIRRDAAQAAIAELTTPDNHATADGG